MKILIVEDEPEMQKVVSDYLQDEQFRVESAFTYQEAEHKIADYVYDAILVDVMLPDGNGLGLLPLIKSTQPQSAVLILSAKNAVDDRIEGLNVGADDYLTKPYHLAELQARIRAIVRRKWQGGSMELTYENIELNPQERQVRINGEQVSFNRKEYDLLHYFLSRPGKLIPKTMLAEAVWGDAIDQADRFDFIYSQIKNVKKKLQQHGAKAQLQAVYGIGYKLM